MAPREHFRAAARYAIDLPIAIREAPGAVMRDARLVDVSLGGARVEVAGDLRDGSMVVLEVKTPTLWDPLVIEALVAWSTNSSTVATLAGLKFVHRTPSTLSALFDLLSAQEFESL